MMEIMQRRSEIKPVMTEGVVSRQSQEVQGMVYMAKQFPRDEYLAQEKIMKACERKTLAETAMYEYPRGGQKVTGPSIRLAEAIAQGWGNIDFGIMELEQKFGESTVMAYAWDLENNTRQTKIFTVKHERKAGGQINKLTDPRDIYEMVANQGARRVRSCILGVIPGDIVEAAVEKCKETLTNDLGGKIAEAVEKLAAAFEKQFKVTKDQLEKLIGCKSEAFSANDVVRLKTIYTSLKDGMSKPQEYFGGKGETEAKKSKLEEEMSNESNPQ
jgi:hypothetical protein